MTSLREKTLTASGKQTSDAKSGRLPEWSNLNQPPVELAPSCNLKPLQRPSRGAESCIFYAELIQNADKDIAKRRAAW
ncbi:MAG: hypothetical protein RLZZ253_238, partial [Verrucomicrobiota bacterium]